MLPSLLVPTLTGVAVVEDGVDVVEYGVDVVEYGVDVVEDGVVVTVVVPVLEAQLEIGFPPGATNHRKTRCRSVRALDIVAIQIIRAMIVVATRSAGW